MFSTRKKIRRIKKRDNPHDVHKYLGFMHT